ncbi:hypothetical protein ACS8FD_06385 [Psychrobacter sp. 1U2]|uniref:hypothetical protein n=1 Tax=Psychrobacter sp. 1U2 TaxID=3453577 RepID=UPI003F45A78D
MTLHTSQKPYSSIAILSALIISSASLVGCNNTSSATNTVATASTSTVAALSPAVQTVVGDYASEGYAKRAQGNDWVAVMISANGSEQINIKVRARSDVKKPTCTFDGQAKLMGQDQAHGVIFETRANDSKVFLQFQNGKLTIDSDDKYALNYYCSGGASIVGEYQKLKTNLELS